MATEQNNTRINTFTDGMNTDVAYDSMKNSLYIYAINLRPYTTSKINGPQDIAAYGKYGVLTPVYHTDGNLFVDLNDLPTYKDEKGEIKPVNFIKRSTISKIITSGDINILIYILKGCIYLYKISIPDERLISTAYKYNREFLCYIDTGIGDLKNISAVLQYETDRVTNLYLADGKHKIMIINVVDTDYIKSLRDTNGKINIDYISLNNYFPKKAVKYRAITSGLLKTSQVLYTYRFYKKHGVTSKLAPLSRKFQVINPSRGTEIGCSEDSITSIGLLLQIDVNENISQFDRILVYRIQYVKPNLNADIDLIYDGGFEANKELEEWSILIIDNGRKTLLTLTMLEFSQIHGQDIIPKLLEQNQGYLFAGNVKDTTIFQLSRDDLKKFWAFLFTKDVENGDHKCYCFVNENLTEDQSVSDPNSIPGEQTYIGTISWLMNAFNNPKNSKAYNTDYVNPYSDINHTRYRNYTDSMYDYYGYIGGSGDCISWRLVATELEDGKNNQNASYYFKLTNGKPVVTSEYISASTNTVKNAKEILTYNGFPTANPTHNDAVTSSCIKSLKRGEVYRYGIVLYKEDGTRSDVIWIGDIRIPGPDVIPLTNGENGTYQIGIEFVEEDGFSTFAEHNNICGYEIVRCQRTNEYSRSLQQVVISSTVRLKMIDGNYSPYYPTGFIISNPLYIGYTPYEATYSGIEGNPAKEETQWPEVDSNQMTSGASDNRLYLIYCPEMLTYVDDVLNKLKVNQISLTPALYLYSSINYNVTNEDIIRFTTDNAYDPSTYKQIKKSNEAQKNRIFSLSFIPLIAKAVDKHGTYTDTYIDTSNYTFGKYTNLNYKVLSYSKDDKSDKTNKLKYLKSANTVYSRRFFKRDKEKVYHENLEPRAFSNKVDIDNVYYTKETDFNLNQYNYSKSIQAISSVKMLNWEDGFSNHVISGGKIENAVKKYKSYIKNISTSNYLNWVCGNKYNIPVGTSNEYGWTDFPWNNVVEFTNGGNADAHKTRTYPSIGPIGPAARCLVIQLSNKKLELKDLLVDSDEVEKHDDNNKVYYDVTSEVELDNIFGEVLTTNRIKQKEDKGHILIIPHTQPDNSINYKDPEEVSKLNSYPGTLLCEITHPAIHYSGKDRFSKQYDTYYGFGDYKEIDRSNISMYVFTGDTYTLIYEIEGMYKAYDFNDDKSSLQSMQTVHYIPMESTINQYFDYGMNYRNTSNANLQSEAGEIKGVSTQDRPVHQYNLIYSDNGTSNDIYSPQSVIQSQNTYSQRICYSQMKTNGELLNNWNIFKPVDYIDVNPVYGELTDMFTVQDTLYFWLNKGFGKLSVNERSLVKDENSNLIQLGQGSVLQRYDYLSTKFGMRDQDMCKINVDNDIYWFDHRNRCIAAYKAVNAGNGRASMLVIDFTYKTNVKTLMKNCDVTDTPTMEYDPNNDELLFNNVTLTDTGEDTDGSYTLAFNCKFDIAQSLYDINGCVNTIYNNKTNQDDIIYINTKINEETKIGLICNSQLSNTKNNTSKYYLKFIVNPNASVTKVFDSQLIVYPHMYYNTYGNTSFGFDNAINFSTDLSKANTLNTNEENSYTDREGNVCFSIPRCLNNNIQRLRGKWMIESIMNNDPESYSSISHIITKFRQSYN